MGSYYYQAYENPLKTILGMAGLTIDAIEASRTLVKQIWKAHMAIVRKMEENRIIADKKRDEEFLKSWHQSLAETEHFRQEHPRGQMVSIREQAERFFK